MDDNFGATYVTITDEEGNEHDLEFISRIKYNERDYLAFFPADTEESSEDAYKIIMFKTVMENGEEMLETIQDDDEAEAVYAKFMETLFDDDDDDEPEIDGQDE